MLTIICLSFNACNVDDFLTIEQQSVKDLDSFYANATDAEAEALVANLYNSFRSTFLNYPFYGIVAGQSDEIYIGGGSASDGGDIHDFGVYKHSPLNSQLQTVYTGLYQLIYKCNLIVEKLPSNSTTKQYIAEARCFRALAHAYLVQLWGTPPFVDHILTADEYAGANGDPEVMWPWILKQFDEAIPDLPKKGALGSQAAIGGRWTQGSAMAMKGKFQVWTGDYANAATTLKSVIDGTYGEYKLWDASGVTPTEGDILFIEGNPFSSMYHKYFDFSDETLFEINVPDDATATYTRHHWSLFTYMSYRQKVFNNPGTLFGQRGWGFFQPTEEYVEAFIEYENDNAATPGSFTKGGPRFNGWIMPYDVLDPHLKLLSELHGNAGYLRRFYTHYDPDCNTYALSQNQQTYTTVNAPIMRLSEVFLLYAEAAIQSGSQAGLPYINEIRQRAGLKTLASYTLEDVKQEKRFELYADLMGSRFIDVVRWGDAPETFANVGKNILGFSINEPASASYKSKYGTLGFVFKTGESSPNAGFVAGKNELLPFPSKELDQNPNLKQNKGYN